VRGSWLSAVACHGRRETVGFWPVARCKRLRERHDGLKLKNGLGGGHGSAEEQPERRPRGRDRSPGRVSQLGLASVLISVNPSSRIGTNAENLRGKRRDIRDRMFRMRQPPINVRCSSWRNATIQAARRIRDKPSILLIKGASISVIALTRPEQACATTYQVHHSAVPEMHLHLCDLACTLSPGRLLAYSPLSQLRSHGPAHGRPETSLQVAEILA
jgi:hypothetical protein